MTVSVHKVAIFSRVPETLEILDRNRQFVDLPRTTISVFKSQFILTDASNFHVSRKQILFFHRCTHWLTEATFASKQEKISRKLSRPYQNCPSHTCW